MNGSRMLACGMWFVTRTGGVIPPAFSPETSLKRELMRKAIALVGVTPRTKMFAGVARALDVGTPGKREFGEGEKGEGWVGELILFA